MVVNFNLKERHEGVCGAKAATLGGNDHQISGHASGTSFQHGQACLSLVKRKKACLCMRLDRARQRRHTTNQIDKY